MIHFSTFEGPAALAGACAAGVKAVGAVREGAGAVALLHVT